MGNFLSIATGVGMAIGPPLIYADQAWSIVKKQDSTGFSMDVCAVLLVANIMRCVFWLGSRFELPLLFQSLFLIVAMLALLYLLLKYRKDPADGGEKPSKRPLNFWQWPAYGQYIEFLAGLIVLLCTAYLILGSYSWFIDALGFVALGIESQLPTPQAISNFKRKSCYGLQISTLAGWFIGDVFKTIYFLLKGSPKQFTICGAITVSIDSIIIAQRIIYGAKPPNDEDAAAYEEEGRRLTALDGRRDTNNEEEEEEVEQAPQSPQR